MHSLEAMFDLASVDAEPSNRDMQGAGSLEV
jgi:hypothetical protein